MAGFGPDGDLFESATVRANADGTVTVVTGTSPHGQGHETAWAQLVATELGIAMDRVVVRHGDTATVPVGLGTFGSRSAAVGGTAVHLAAGEVAEKARRLAAHLLEAATADIVVSDGQWRGGGGPGPGGGVFGGGEEGARGGGGPGNQGGAPVDPVVSAPP